MSKSTGGYIVAQSNLIRSDRGAHTAALERPISPAHLDALNAIQATPWRINNYVLEVARKAYVMGLSVGGLGTVVLHPVPPRLSDEAWEALALEDRRKHARARRAAGVHNTSAQGRLMALLDALTVAEELRDQESIWFPHSLDFRGRMYPVSTGSLNPQGRDLAKALLMFSEGKPLGPDGEFWLCVRAANSFGKDKLSLQDRLAWALDHHMDIMLSAVNPLEHPWWSEAADPWCFLATCHELYGAWMSPLSADFVSHLPIPMDGSCSGIQHLSAMGLDPIGAKATNLCAGLPRQDIYQEVADKIITKIDQEDTPESAFWRGRINRSTVKRAVMTTPYGVTSGGIARQLLADGFVEDAPPGDRTALAAYLRDRLTAALAETVVAAKEIMGWLQDTAMALAKANLPLIWATPVGSRFRQAYHEEKVVRVNTLSGKFVLKSDNLEGALCPSKSANASAPNIIHSFDAAHMVLTVNQGAQEGISAWAMVHDSFGTHACQTTKLNAILRHEFVWMYRQDWLRAIRDEIVAYAPHVALPPLPKRGSFDLQQVIGSEFCFS